MRPPRSSKVGGLAIDAHPNLNSFQSALDDPNLFSIIRTEERAVCPWCSPCRHTSHTWLLTGCTGDKLSIKRVLV